MIRQLRVLTIVTAFVLAAATSAAANTVELTLQIPIKITLGGHSAAIAVVSTQEGKEQEQLKPFDVYCAVGSNLGYATGVGAQGNIVGQSSTATAGSKNVTGTNGLPVANPSATVIITYDDGTSANIGSQTGGVGSGRAATLVNSYLCWVQWKDPLPSIPPIFVQGQLQPQ
jgi:hypothetical protein